MTRDSFTKAFQLFISIPVRIVLIFFSTLVVVGKDNLRGLDRSKGIIFAANHNSQLDSISLPCSLPFMSDLTPVHFVSLENEKYSGYPIGKFFYGGKLFECLGAYSIKSGLKNYAGILA